MTAAGVGNVNRKMSGGRWRNALTGESGKAMGNALLARGRAIKREREIAQIMAHRKIRKAAEA